MKCDNRNTETLSPSELMDASDIWINVECGLAERICELMQLGYEEECRRAAVAEQRSKGNLG